MTELIVYSDDHSEDTSVDGYTVEQTEAAWGTIRAAGGDYGNDNGAAFAGIGFTADANANEWDDWTRAFLLFDATAIPGGSTIDSATLGTTITSVYDAFTDSLVMVTSAPASDTAIVAGDHDSSGTTANSNTRALANLVLNTVGHINNRFTLNAPGLANIKDNAISKFAIISEYDRDNDEPTYSSGGLSYVVMASADTGLGSDRRPTLTIQYTAPPFTPRAMMF